MNLRPSLLASVSLLTLACSNSSSPSAGPPDSGKSTKPPPSTAADAPVLEALESSIQDTVKAGNTPIPQGVRCDPDSDTATDIVYACTVLASKTQTTTELGLPCGATDAKVETGSGASQPLTASTTTKAGASFGISIAKDAFPTLVDVSLTASCGTAGGGVRVNRPYRLTPKS